MSSSPIDPRRSTNQASPAEQTREAAGNEVASIVVPSITVPPNNGEPDEGKFSYLIVLLQTLTLPFLSRGASRTEGQPGDRKT